MVVELQETLVVQVVVEQVQQTKGHLLVEQGVKEVMVEQVKVLQTMWVAVVVVQLQQEQMVLRVQM